MQVQQNLNSLSGISGIFNEANRLLSDQSQVQNTQNIAKINTQEQENLQNFFEEERVTYGLVSLEIMSDTQYQAFMRVTAGMSPNEKISVAQMLTRAGNLSASVEQVREQEQQVAEQNAKSALGFLGVSQEGWQEVAKDFQNKLNNLDGIYTKAYNRNPTSNYNDILRQNNEAKTQRILREFSHAVHSGNAQIDIIG
ncbi:MAG: hypothetical protein SOW25_05335 [Helicobacter sp.]|nr:hypothetical protein [Helicobacteraceae bacterium]MDY3113735.1 hypothetical protein [Helicobacter sp.]